MCHQLLRDVKTFPEGSEDETLSNDAEDTAEAEAGSIEESQAANHNPEKGVGWESWV